MILEKTKFYISKHIMAAQTQIKLCIIFLHFWMSITPKPIQSKLSTLLILQDQMENYHKILKKEVLGNYSAWKWFQNLLCSKFSKKTSRFRKPGNQVKTKFRFEFFFFYHMPFYIWTQYNIKNVLGT